MNASQPTTLARRSLIKATGGIGLAAAGGLALVPQAAQAAPVPASTSPRAPTGSSGPSRSWRTGPTRRWRSTTSTGGCTCCRVVGTMGQRPVPQSVSFSGAPLSTMYLDNVGHGVGFGVEPVGKGLLNLVRGITGLHRQGNGADAVQVGLGQGAGDVKYYFKGLPGRQLRHGPGLPAARRALHPAGQRHGEHQRRVRPPVRSPVADEEGRTVLPCPRGDEPRAVARIRALRQVLLRAHRNVAPVHEGHRLHARNGGHGDLQAGGQIGGHLRRQEPALPRARRTGRPPAPTTDSVRATKYGGLKVTANIYYKNQMV